jgi:hypothetical protein
MLLMMVESTFCAIEIFARNRKAATAVNLIFFISKFDFGVKNDLLK